MSTRIGADMPFLKTLASPFIKFKQALTPGEDYWTWTDVEGHVYEDVDLVKMERDQVTIRHKYGVTSIAKMALAEKIQKSLKDDLEIAESFCDQEDHFLNRLKK